MTTSKSSRVRYFLGVVLIVSSAAVIGYDAWERASQDNSARRAQQALELSLNFTDKETSETTASVTPESIVELAPPTYAEGDAVGLIKSAGGEINAVFVMGTSEESLSKGPGIFATSAMPGMRGNTAIAGHRTSHGAPFRHIDKLSSGEEIRVETEYGTFRYIVTGVAIIGPRDVRVLSDKTGADLTLIACHPLHSTRQRIVVTAEMTT